MLSDGYNLDECSKCKFWNKDYECCSAIDCYPGCDCTEPLPCEEKDAEENE